MDRLRRRPEPAAIDITWVSCRGVRSSIPFHTPCLYTSIYLTSSSGAERVNGRRPHRVKTPTDRFGGRNPEWDQRLRLYVAGAPSPDGEGGAGDSDSDDGLVVRFDLKAEVAVLGDMLTASAVVPVSDLVADGRTRRVSYQLAASDGKQPNGVISFSYTFHEGSTKEDQEDRSSSDGEPIAPLLTDGASAAATLPPQPQSVSRMYPAIDWSLTEQPAAVYPPVVTSDTITRSSNYYPQPPPVAPVEAVTVYPPSLETSTRCIYPAVREPASGMYPTVELAPVTCYPPTVYAPEWDAARCL